MTLTRSRTLTVVVMPLEHDTDRPVHHRPTARVLVLDPDERVLLLEDSDPTAPGAPSFWITPGGGLEEAESAEIAALREVAEETGLIVDPADLRGPLGERTVVHAYSDKIVVNHEIFFVVRADRFAPHPAALTVDEQRTLRGYRWWSGADIAASDQLIWPVGLSALITAAADPSSWPVTLSRAEESTVPFG